MYRRIRRIRYSWSCRSHSFRSLRNSGLIICITYIFFQNLYTKLFNQHDFSTPQKTRLHPNESIKINLAPFPVCHPNELYLKNLTLEYHQRYPDKNKQVCFVVDQLDGGPWWSYVTQEFAEILTQLRQIGIESNIKYQMFSSTIPFNVRTNFTKFFLKTCGIDENLPKEDQVPIVALLWNINRFPWQAVANQVEYLLSKTRIRIVAFIDDLHFLTSAAFRSRQYLFTRVASEILSTYSYLFDNYYKNITPNKITWLPHAASTLSHNSVNESAENVIFVSGANLPEWYPCRARAFRLCKSRQDLTTCLDHPGYGITMKNDSSHYYGGERYFSYMRKYVFGLGTCQSVHYAIAKLFEIPANGLVLVTTNDLVPILQSLGLYRDEHFLTIDCSSSETLTNEFMSIRNMSQEVLFQIRTKSQKIIHERHLTKHRAQLIHARLLSQALIASSISDEERLKWQQWGRHCY